MRSSSRSRDAARAGQARADGLRGGLAVQVVLVADPLAQLVQQIAGRRRAVVQQLAARPPSRRASLRPVALELARGGVQLPQRAVLGGQETAAR